MSTADNKPIVNFLDPRLPQRFWSKVVPEPNSGCWLWFGSNSGYRSLYGCFENRQFGTKLAHRIAWMVLVGPIGDGLVIDHLCRTHCCVNPAHLEPVSQRDNVHRGVAPTAANALKTHCPQGHEYTPENTIPIKSLNGRGCRECRRRQFRNWYDKNRRAA